MTWNLLFYFYFSKEVLWSWFPILVLPPENWWAPGCLYHSLPLGPFTTRVVIPPCWQLALIPQGSSLLRDLMMVFLKGFKYHIKHDLRAIITQYHVFTLDFTKAQSNHFASNKRTVSSQNQQQSHVSTLLVTVTAICTLFFILLIYHKIDCKLLKSAVNIISNNQVAKYFLLLSLINGTFKTW